MAKGVSDPVLVTGQGNEVRRFFRAFRTVSHGDPESAAFQHLLIVFRIAEGDDLILADAVTVQQFLQAGKFVEAFGISLTGLFAGQDERQVGEAFTQREEVIRIAEHENIDAVAVDGRIFTVLRVDDQIMVFFRGTIVRYKMFVTVEYNDPVLEFESG